MSFEPMGDPGEHRGLPRDLMQDIKRAAYEAKAREMREETERRCGGRLSPTDREAVDSVVSDIVEEAAERDIWHEWPWKPVPGQED